MNNPFKTGDIVKAIHHDHYSLIHNCEYRVRYVKGPEVAVEGKAGWYPWTDFKKAGEMTPNPNADSTGAAADQGVLVITEGLLFKNLDKVQRIAKTYANKAMPPLADQREAVLIQFLVEVLSALSKEA